MDPLVTILAQHDDIPHVHRALRVVTTLLAAGRKYEVLPVPLATAHLRNVYGRRAALNRSRGNVIPGLQEFAEALLTEPEFELALFSAQSTKEIFNVFTTPDLSRLVGLIAAKPNNPGNWMRPEHGPPVDIG